MDARTHAKKWLYLEGIESMVGHFRVGELGAAEIGLQGSYENNEME